MPALARRRVLMSPAEIERAVSRMAHQIIEPEEAQSGLVIIGIRRGGESLARRLVTEIASIGNEAPGLGFLNINLYRDDDVARELPESEIRSEITGKTVVIVDDVLYTGRTVRAALDAVTDLGRPRAIRLARADRSRIARTADPARLRRQADPDEPARAHRRRARAAAVGRRLRRAGRR